MRADQAVQMVKGMIFRPGWKLGASRYPGSPGEVYIEAEITTVDTSYPTPEGEYKVPLSTTISTAIDVTGLDLDGLCARIIRWAESYDSHEDREFLRVWDGGRWRAPLHPHTAEGQLSWQILERERELAERQPA